MNLIHNSTQNYALTTALINSALWLRHANPAQALAEIESYNALGFALQYEDSDDMHRHLRDIVLLRVKADMASDRMTASVSKQVGGWHILVDRCGETYGFGPFKDEDLAAAFAEYLCAETVEEFRRQYWMHSPLM